MGLQEKRKNIVGKNKKNGICVLAVFDLVIVAFHRTAAIDIAFCGIL